MGDPAGIGPEIIARSMASSEVEGLAIFVILGDERVMRKAFTGSGTRVAYHPYGVESVTLDVNSVNVVDPSPLLADNVPGVGSEAGARKALAAIDAAVSIMLSMGGPERSAVVTAPVSKGAIASIKPGFIGHTEYLADALGARKITMLLTGEKLKVAPVTRHIPLKEVPRRLNTKDIIDTILQIAENSRVICGKDNIRIGVCGLNPHCGENGKMGMEEIDMIAPAVSSARERYPDVEGPVPADVAFYKAITGKYDVVVGMYHDQCLAPFKMVDFDAGVNMTLGLKYVRTSPDHGTAFDIAGKGAASPGSMIAAVKLAARALKAAGKTE
jgi:4-hydroxythreonine-4-phosphate dehydrogenase